MNWKKLIQTDGKVDLESLPYYFIKFTEKSPVMEVYGYKVILPVPPADELCMNYGLPIEEQVFRKTYIPKDLAKWPEKRRDEFIEGEYNRRHNGIWIFIKGKKYYITGVFYFFLNYWTSTTSPTIKYRYCDLEFFIMWFMVVHDPKSYGLIVYKCRQLGETEKSICILYEYATRVKNAKCPMQSINETDIYENAYKRILHAHGEMIFFMKAAHRGTSDPKDGLFFDYQRETVNKEKLKKNQQEHGVAIVNYDDYMHPPLNSSIVYGPTKPHVFGTGTFGRYYLDEFGKMEQMNPLYAWNVVKQAMFNRMDNVILGKALFTSTVEELKGGDTLTVAKQMWTQSDPEKRNSNGETITGLYRIFRSSLDAAPIDHWGFPQKELAREKNKSEIQARINSGDIKGKIEYMRMNAETIEDVFQNTNEGSQFDIEKLAARLFFLESQSAKKLWVRGNLKWKDGVRDTEVIWEPNPKGKWVISKHPKDLGLMANHKIQGVIAPKPANTAHFCCGVDPIDQQTTLEAEPSKGGIAVFSRLNSLVDGGTERYYQFSDESRGIIHGDPVDGGVDFQTNRFVCTYLDRPADPSEFFEDCIMTWVYYGTDFLPEKDRFGGLHTYIKQRGYELYLMEKPTQKGNYRGQVEREGMSATTGNIDTYFTLLTTLSCKWWNTLDIPDLLQQLLSMNWANRGKKDLGVAAGWALIAATTTVSRKVQSQQGEKVRHFSTNYV